MKRAWLVLALAACEGLPILPPAPDSGQVKVPGTYHDAQRSPGHRAHLALEGERELSCRDCHFVADAGFSAAAVKPCAECHAKQQAQHHPFDGGVAMSCFSCHAFRATSEQWGCGECHVKPRAGAPHVGVHVEKCERCHRPHGAPFTAAADCGQCHDVTVSHGKGEKALPADTCMTCHPHHSAAKAALGLCTGCHVGGALPQKAQVRAGALFEKGHAGCSTCHAPHAFTALQAKGCSGCHAQKPVLAAEKHVACITCHRPHDERAGARSCEGCHVKEHVQHPKDALGRPCLGCHPVHAPESATRIAVPCVTCHALDGAVVHAKTTGCSSCHAGPHLGKPQRGPLCVTCHEKQLTLVKGNKGHQDCDRCHAGLPHGPPAPPVPCLTCHEKKQPPQAGHVACASCHQSHSAKVTAKCTDCHGLPGKPLPGLHQVAKHQKCSTCHAAHVPEPGVGPATCRSCHAQLSVKSHPGAPQQCVSCHLFSAPR